MYIYRTGWHIHIYRVNTSTNSPVHMIKYVTDFLHMHRGNTEHTLAISNPFTVFTVLLTLDCLQVHIHCIFIYSQTYT